MADVNNDIKAVADDVDAVKKKLKNVGNGKGQGSREASTVMLIHYLGTLAVAAVASMIAQPKTDHIPATLKRTETEVSGTLCREM